MTVTYYQRPCPYSTPAIDKDKFKHCIVRVLLFVLERLAGRLLLAWNARRIACSGCCCLLTPLHWPCALPTELIAAATHAVFALETY